MSDNLKRAISYSKNSFKDIFSRGSEKFAICLTRWMLTIQFVQISFQTVTYSIEKFHLILELQWREKNRINFRCSLLMMFQLSRSIFGQCILINRDETHAENYFWNEHTSAHYSFIRCRIFYSINLKCFSDSMNDGKKKFWKMLIKRSNRSKHYMQLWKIESTRKCDFLS